MRAAADRKPVAVVLAAGRGSRLGPLTRDRPKCLVEILGEPILGWTVRALEQFGVDRLIVVVGYRHEQIREFFGGQPVSMPVTYVLNESYAETGTAQSLQLGLEAVPPNRALLVIEGDIVFEPELLHHLALVRDRSSTSLAPYRPDLHGTFARCSRRGLVTAWYHESTRPPGFRLASAYKTVNLHFFPAAAVENALRPALARTLARWGRAVPFERAMQLWLQDRMAPIQGIDVGKTRWYEVDTIADLAVAERQMLDGA